VPAGRQWLTVGQGGFFNREKHEKGLRGLFRLLGCDC
jgi:hypothetical protein